MLKFLDLLLVVYTFVSAFRYLFNVIVVVRRLYFWCTVRRLFDFRFFLSIELLLVIDFWIVIILVIIFSICLLMCTLTTTTTTTLLLLLVATIELPLS